MKLRYKIANTFLLLLGLGVVAIAITLSYSSSCGPAPGLSEGTDSMKAIMQRCYGSPDVITFEDVEKPVPADDEILVKVIAAAINPLDWHYVRGTPYFLRLMAGLGAPDNPGLAQIIQALLKLLGPVSHALSRVMKCLALTTGHMPSILLPIRMALSLSNHH